MGQGVYDKMYYLHYFKFALRNSYQQIIALMVNVVDLGTPELIGWLGSLYKQSEALVDSPPESPPLALLDAPTVDKT